MGSFRKFVKSMNILCPGRKDSPSDGKAELCTIFTYISKTLVIHNVQYNFVLVQGEIDTPVVGFSANIFSFIWAKI